MMHDKILYTSLQPNKPHHIDLTRSYINAFYKWKEQQKNYTLPKSSSFNRRSNQIHGTLIPYPIIVEHTEYMVVCGSGRTRKFANLAHISLVGTNYVYKSHLTISVSRRRPSFNNIRVFISIRIKRLTRTPSSNTKYAQARPQIDRIIPACGRLTMMVYI